MVQQQFDIMVGIGCGYPPEGTEKRHTHHLPIDTVNYLAEAEKIRIQNNFDQGALILADINVHFLRAKYRKTMLQRILNVLKINDNWVIIPQTTLQDERRQLGPIALSRNIPESSKEYFENELGDVSLILKPKGVKIGWAINYNKHLRGGEITFDEEINNNWPEKNYKFVYLPPGIATTRRTGLQKCPYLVRADEFEHRICLTKKDADLDREIGKLGPHISKEAIDQIVKLSQNIGINTDPENIREILRASLEKFIQEQVK